MTVAAEPDKPQVTGTEEPTQLSLHERMEKIVDDHLNSTSGAAEPEPATTAADGTDKSQAGDAKPESTPTLNPAKLEATAEQLASTKFWGALNAEDVKRAERDYPVAYAHWKAGQAAGTRAVNEARAEAERIINEARAKATPQTQTTDDEDEPSPEYLAAVEIAQTSTDLVEVAKAHRKIARLNAAVTSREIGIDPNAIREERILEAAFAEASKEQPELPRLMRDHRTELQQIVEADPVLTALADTGTPQNVKLVMLRSAESLLAKQKAEADAQAEKNRLAEIERKKTEHQTIVKSNARPATQDVLNSRGAPPAKPTLKERWNSKLDEYGVQ